MKRSPMRRSASRFGSQSGTHHRPTVHPWVAHEHRELDGVDQPNGCDATALSCDANSEYSDDKHHQRKATKRASPFPKGCFARACTTDLRMIDLRGFCLDFFWGFFRRGVALVWV